MARRAFLGVLVLGLAAVGVAALSTAAFGGSVYHPLPEPCLLFDTRNAGGAMAAGELRTFHVVGSASDFAGQGARTAGCGVPGFSGGQPVATAAVINLIAIKPTGSGSLRAWPTDGAEPNEPLVTFAKLTPSLSIANASVIALRQDVEGADISIRSGAAGAHVRGAVMGFFTELEAEEDPSAIRKGNNGSGLVAGQITSGRFRLTGADAGPLAVIFASGIANVNAEKNSSNNCILSVLNSPFSGRTYTFTRQVFPTGGAASFTDGTLAGSASNSINLGAGGSVRWQMWDPGAASATGRVITIEAFARQNSTTCDFGATMYTGGS